MKASNFLPICIASLLFLTSINASAQLRGSTIGIKGGVNVSHLAINDLNSEQNLLGYHAGAFVRLGLTRSFGIQPEVLISSKGTVLDYNSFVNGEANVRLNYVEVPVLAVFKIIPFVNIQAGPYWAYLTNISVGNKSGDGDADLASQINKDNFKNIDYGYVLGAGVEFGKLALGARYVQGLSDIGKTKEFFGQPYNFPGARNSSYQMYLGLKFL